MKVCTIIVIIIIVVVVIIIVVIVIVIIIVIVIVQVLLGAFFLGGPWAACDIRFQVLLADFFWWDPGRLETFDSMCC